MHVVSQTCSWSATATNLIRKLNCCFRNLSSWFWIRTCCSVILIDSQDSLKLHIPVKITPSLWSVNVWSRDEVCVPSWLVWSAAQALPWCAVSLTRLIISKAGGIRRSHSHLKDVLICTDLLKIVFLGTSPNYLNGFGLLLWPRVRQVNTVLLSPFFFVLLSSIVLQVFCSLTNKSNTFTWLICTRSSDIFHFDKSLQSCYFFCLKCIYALEFWHDSRCCNAANSALNKLVRMMCFLTTSEGKRVCSCSERPDWKTGLKACHHILRLATSHGLPDLSVTA